MTEKVYFTVKETDVKDFKTYLYERENAETTISKYSTDLRCFLKFLGNSREVDKARLLAYKEWLIECRATLSGSHKQHFIIANFSRKKAQSHLNDTVMPLFLHSFSSVPGY